MPVDEILARYSEFTQQVCACTDNDCLERVTDDRNRYAHAMKKKYGEPSLSAEESARVDAVIDAYRTCVERIVKIEPNRPRAAEQKMFVPMAALRDRMCQCSDKACVDRVKADGLALMNEVGHMPLDEDEEARLKTIADEMQTCGFRAVTSRKPAPKP